jgi:hypothetical protein
MNKTILVVLLVFLCITLFATFASANEETKPVKTTKKLGCKCSARSVLKCGIGKSDEAGICRKKYVEGCRVRCTLLNTCASKIAEECKSKKQGSVDFKKCARYTAATFCVSEVDKSLIKDCKCKTFSRALCGTSSGKDFVRCRDNAYDACKQRCGDKLECTHKQRICISQSKCSCKTISREKCAKSEEYGACFAKELNTCTKRCRASTRCFPLSCKNAGLKRCARAVTAVCEKHVADSEKHSECLKTKTQRCQAFELATCKKARRLFRYRFECTARAEKRCGKLAGAEKCKCIESARHSCIVEKIRQRKIYIRYHESCKTRARLICDEKKCENVKECYEQETRRCHRRHRRVPTIVPPSCVDKVHKLCGNTEGKCFKRHIRRCAITWITGYCEHRSFKVCDGDFECMKGEILKCKKTTHKCVHHRNTCNDNNKCTTDICHPHLGCINVPKNCNDNDLCTKDRCDAKVGCVHEATDCDDGIGCTVDTCNAKNGQCEHKRVHSKCSTDKECTTGICSEKGCVYNTDEINCKRIHVPDLCTKCVAKSACEKVTCDVKKDLSVECKTEQKVCDDGKECTVDFCDSETGRCIHRPVRSAKCSGQICDTNENCSSWGLQKKLHKDCKVAYCDAKLGACIVVENKNKHCVRSKLCTEKCKKRNACDVEAKCSKDVHGNISCDRPANVCDDGKKCTIDSCNEKTGVCEHKKVENTAECKHYCAADIDCAAWASQQKLIQNCQEAYCNKVDATCAVKDLPNKPNCKGKCDIECQPRNKCEKSKCIGSPNGWVCQRTEVSCDDGDKCTRDYCDFAAGCINKAIDGCTKCPVDCQASGKCQHAKCVKDSTGKYSCSITQRVCDDKDECTFDYCDAKVGCVHVFKTDCTIPKGCVDCKPRHKCETAACHATQTKKGFKCVYETVSCTDNDKCTVDSCNALTGKCVHVLKNNCDKRCEVDCGEDNKCSKCVQVGKKDWKCSTAATNCDDNDACTIDTCDAQKGCVHKLIQSERCKKCDEDADCVELNSYLNLYKTCQQAVCDSKKKHCVVTDLVNKSECTKRPPHCFATNACETVTYFKDAFNRSVCKRVVKSCNDGIDCTFDYCDTKTGKCVHVARNCPLTHHVCHKDEDCAKLSATVQSLCKTATCNRKTNRCVVVKDTTRVCHPVEQCKDCVAKNPCETADCTFNQSGKPVCARKSISCDDGNVCTKDTCDVNLGCIHSQLPSCCVDATQCPQQGCAANADCVSWGKNKNLSAKCREAFCDNELGRCKSRLSADQSQCKPTTTPPVCTCPAVNACQQSQCVLGEDNVSQCSVTTKSCDDGNKCTTDSCNISTGECVHTRVQSPECTPICTKDADCAGKAGKCQGAYCKLSTSTCIVEDFPSAACFPPICANCTAQNPCQKAKCIFGSDNLPTCHIAQTNCNDNNVCTEDYCNVETGDCVHVTVQSDQCTPCENKIDCVNYGIVNKLALICKEAVCDTEQGVCVSQDVKDKSLCSHVCQCEATPCTTAACVNTDTNQPVCQKTSKNCDDNNACTVDTCDATSGNCVHTPNDNSCDDGDICTKDVCDVVKGCLHTAVPDSPQCVSCSVNKHCTQYAITHNLANTCQEAYCNKKGRCSSKPTGQLCNVPKCTCAARPCSSVSCTLDANNKPVCNYIAKSCDDKSECTVDSCDIKTGLCVNTLINKNAKTCSSQVDCVNWFNKLDIADKQCKQVGCSNGCCKVSLKSGITHCTVPKCPSTLSCTTANPCLKSECALDETLSYVCTTEPNPLACNDNNVCTKDTCDSVKGCTNTPIPGCNSCTPSSCQGDLCTTATLTTNQDGTCTCTKTPVSCNDGVSCTVDSCDIKTGKCINTFTPSAQCQQICTNNIQCYLFAHQNNLASKCQNAICDTGLGSCVAQDDPSCHSATQECNKNGQKDICSVTTAIKVNGKYQCKTVQKNCNDFKSCTIDTCDAKTGNCIHTYNCTTPQCNANIDCTAWGQAQQLTLNCSSPICDTASGSCHAVANQDTSNCHQKCNKNSDCAQSTYGSVCVSNTCTPNTCSFDSDCYAGSIPGKTWCYCDASATTAVKSCSCKPVCATNECCDDGNPCTNDHVLPHYGFCVHETRCDDSNACTIDTCIPSSDKKTYTCHHTTKSCSNNSTLAALAITDVPADATVTWTGKCDKTYGCIGCVIDAQCDDHNGCSKDSCVQQYCVSVPIDNQWCDPKIASQPITFQSIPGLRDKLALAGYDIAALGE